MDLCRQSIGARYRVVGTLCVAECPRQLVLVHGLASSEQCDRAVGLVHRHRNAVYALFLLLAGVLLPAGWFWHAGGVAAFTLPPFLSGLSFVLLMDWLRRDGGRSR